MSDYTALQSLRAEVTEPTPAQLAPAFARLDRAMREVAPQEQEVRIADPVPAASHVGNRKRVGHRVGWSLGAVGGALALTLVGGNVALAVESARASELLREIAGTTVAFEDAVPAPGQYLLASTRADWGVIAGDEADPATAEYQPNEQRIDVYMPADPSDEWVLVRDWGAGEAVTAEPGSGEHVEHLTAPHGAFYHGLGDLPPGTDPAADPGLEEGWIGVDLGDIPTESGEAAYAWIDGQYADASASRAEDNFDRIAGLLRTGLIPAAQRAALLEALALVPGVTSTAGVPNLDGMEGVAFGRTEALRNDERMEIIVDPETGLVIGERMLTGVAVFGFGANEVTSSTAIETRVVDDAP
ncbi:hypothetical protein [Leucobacter tenebrionis]|uniref:hypothetical protein n=1 Tax=Leucobacter tenebrionis TaxID=2873270 RepID=UPI001CA74BCE|nr:hypothetical protein [Leucobacter tenebrionis]QZY51106.1 hypothetical protein KVY00_10855 [Leucobacter tenebrionis]